MANATADPRPRLTGLQIGLLAVLLLALLGSVGYRAYARTKDHGGTATPAGGHGLVQDDDGSQRTATPLERTLPYVTEGSFFGLVGFALGFASRKFVKIALILLALAFVGLQALVWTGSVSVDWSGLVGKLNGLLFNLSENETLAQFLTRRVPAAGGMLTGYAIGFHRG